MLAYDGILEPRSGNDVIVAGCLAKATTAAAVPVGMINVEDTPILIRQGKLVGDFHYLDESVDPKVRGTYELLEHPEGDWPSESAEEKQDPSLADVDWLGRKLEEDDQMERQRHCLRKNADTKQKPRETPCHLGDEVEEQVGDMVRDGIMEPCDGPCSSTLGLVGEKKNGDIRCCADYRGLNAVTGENAHCLPRSGMAGATIFRTLDLTSGYWQVPVSPEDRDRTAFSLSLDLNLR